MEPRKIKTDWVEETHNQNYDSCFLGFFDILGFSQIVQTKTFKEAYYKVLQFLHLSNLARGFGGDPTKSETIQSGEHHPIIKSVAISDSLLLFTSDISAECLYNLLQTGRDLVSVGMRGMLPIRGAISFGQFFWNFESRIFIGPALADAVHWEKKAQWAGVVLTPNCANHVYGKQEYQDVLTHCLKAQQQVFPKESGITKSSTIIAPLVVEYEVQMEGPTKHLLRCINWAFPFEFDPKMDWLGRAFFWMRGMEKEDVQIKYENTKDFLIHCSGLMSKI